MWSYYCGLCGGGEMVKFRRTLINRLLWSVKGQKIFCLIGGELEVENWICNITLIMFPIGRNLLLVWLSAILMLPCLLIKGVLVLVYAYGMIWIDLSLQRQTYFWRSFVACWSRSYDPSWGCYKVSSWLGLQTDHFELDCKVEIDSFNIRYPAQSDFGAILRLCKDIFFFFFTNIKICFIRRQTNCVTDS